jgi:2-keto-4-pentenoate hydratase/2-oxohepta-3-ene-1,7-dioic acid hydratase in catechol pathway
LLEDVVEVPDVVRRRDHHGRRPGGFGLAVSNMTYGPWELVSFHSEVMTLLPGDVISTGTPGAVVLRGGDVLECRIEGFEPLKNPVRRY